MASSKKEIAKSVKTLLVMLQSMRNQQVTITLRNDTIVKGTILGTDASMNIELANATVDIDRFYQTTQDETADCDDGNRSAEIHDYFVVKGTRIRHIDLPSDCDHLASAQCEIERIRNRCKQWTKRDIVRGHS